MTYIPLIMECPNCGKIFTRGRVGKGRNLNIRHKCPHCNTYIKIWHVRKFFRCEKSGYNIADLVEIEYKTIKPTLRFIRVNHKSRVARLTEERKRRRINGCQ